MRLNRNQDEQARSKRRSVFDPEFAYRSHPRRSVSTSVGSLDFGYRAVENRVHIHDLHATLLHLMGFDHERLTYRHAGRDFRLTDVHGRIVKEILA